MNKHLCTIALLALALPAAARAEVGIAGTAGTLGLESPIQNIFIEL